MAINSVFSDQGLWYAKSIKEASAKQNSSHAIKSILVGVSLSGEEDPFFEEDLIELESLLKTLGFENQAILRQKRNKYTAATLIGLGKLDEIKTEIVQHGAKLVVFNEDLTGPQVRNLEKYLGADVRVMDRTSVIIDIFAKHARTNQARTQVEIAHLKYILPRLSHAWSHFHRQTGGSGVNSRGMGEKQLEIDRRRARERISKLEKMLEQFEKERLEQKKQRADQFKVAIVGYTNSGKTTIMSHLTKLGVLGRDELFATLDTHVKKLDPNAKPQILLADTVGFIRKLPHALVACFKSTLSELEDADLILHVVDVSHPMYREHMKVTRKLIEEVGAGEAPEMVIFNKTDLLSEKFLPKILGSIHKDSISICAQKLEDIKLLREHVLNFFKNRMQELSLVVPHSDQQTLSMIYRNCHIIHSDYSVESGVSFQVKAHESILSRLQNYRMDREWLSQSS